MKEAKDPRHSRPQGARHLHFKHKEMESKSPSSASDARAERSSIAVEEDPPPSGTRTEEAKEAHSIFVEDDSDVIPDEEELENLYSAKEKN